MSLSPQIQKKLMEILQAEEKKTDLERLSVLSRVGMKVASATSSELDADAISASSTALIDLGIRLSQSVEHGALREILLHNEKGYGILMAVNDEYLIFGVLLNVLRIGYYMGYLREIARKINELISGGEETEMAINLEEQELRKMQAEKEKIQAEIEEGKLKPSVKDDAAAMEATLQFLKSWGAEGEEEEVVQNNVVSIPESMMMEIPIESKSIPITTGEKTELITQAQKSEELYGIKVYGEEVPPIPLDDYTPMEVEEEIATEEVILEEPPISESIPEITEEVPEESFDYQSFEPPQGSNEFEFAAEYDAEFEIDEDKQFTDILEDLGWHEEKEEE